MSENCSNDCSKCSKECSSRKAESLLEKPHAGTHIKKVIGVISGKGGVGKSLVTMLLAIGARRMGLKTAVLDADITGPSIPKGFGVRQKAYGSDDGIFPVETTTGIKIMSLNLLLENDTDPVVWRGPILAGTVKQFWTEVMWGDCDIMFIDMPPGTGDVPLTVFQSIPLDGVVIVTSPQELVGMIVEKAANMAAMMNIPVMGLVENMSYIECPDCHKLIYPFGESHLEEAAAKHGIPNIARLPINPKLASACDRGTIELFEGSWLDDMLSKLTH